MKISRTLLIRIFRNEKKNQNKFLLQRIGWYSFRCTSGYIVVTLLFNIYTNDLFFQSSDIDIANYADDNTPYVCSSDLDSVIINFRKTPKE